MVMVCIKFPEEERDALKRDAYRHEMTVSDYVKYLVKKEREAECGSGTKR